MEAVGTGGRRNVTASAPITGIEDRLLEKLTGVFFAYSDLDSVILFGSRATGTASPRSDIDLATRGILSRRRLGRLKLDLEDLDIPQRCDVVALEKVRHEPLKRHIKAVGVTIYRRARVRDRETGQR
ncbi:MAG: nucleotidyltransferase domain-containing protein [Gemmatimonadetes bacterium]|nr:nucleotidyltransferase domain-containing protein [Gemmatimonadota bacterium]